MNLVLPLKDVYKCSIQTEVALINDFIIKQMENYVSRIEAYVAHIKDDAPLNLDESIITDVALDTDTMNSIIAEINARIDEGVTPAEIFIAEIDSADMLAMTPAKRFHLTLVAILGSLENEGLKFKIVSTAYGITLVEA